MKGRGGRMQMPTGAPSLLGKVAETTAADMQLTRLELAMSATL